MKICIISDTRAGSGEDILRRSPGPLRARNVRRLGQVAILELGDGKREVSVVNLS